MADAGQDASLASRLDALLLIAEIGGPDASGAARRAAGLADGRDPDRARKALKIAARLDPLDAAPRLALARVHAEQGDMNAARREAAAVYGEGVDQAARARAAFMLGELARAEGDVQTARGAYLDTIKIETALLDADPQDPGSARWYARAKGRIAELDAAAGDMKAAMAGADAALALFRAAAGQIGETPLLAADIADAELRRAGFSFEAGDAGDARMRLGEAIGRYEALAAVEKGEPHWRAMLAEAWTLAAEAALAENAANAAREAINKALQLRLKLAREDDHERWALAGVWRLRAGLAAALGEPGDARESIAQARALTETLRTEAPDSPARKRSMAQVLLEEAAIESKLGDMARADFAAEAALKLCGAESDEAAVAWDRRAAIAAQSGQWERAQDAARRALRCRRQRAADAPKDVSVRRALGAALARSGETAIGAKDYANARRLLQENLELRLALAEAAPGEQGPARDLALGIEQIGRLAAARGDTAGARAAWEEELALAEGVFPPDDNEGARFCAIVESLIASLGGPDAQTRRASALARLDRLAELGQLTGRDVALRAQLWKG